MKYLFLDFDGVLHPKGTGPKFTRLPLFEDTMRQLPDVAIVISSTWRLTFPVDELQEMLGTAGAKVVGRTRAGCEFTVPRFGTRGTEVRDWLKYNGGHDSDWAALDDDPELFGGKDHLILCDGTVGFTQREADLLIEWAKKTPD